MTSKKIKVAFLDRDGTIMVEPHDNGKIPYQITSLEEMVPIPGVISALKKFTELGFHLVMVTNQDGLGTPANPVENYEKVNQKFFQILKSEGIEFFEICKCTHYKEEGCTCRKPHAGMVQEFFKKQNVDLDHSFMVGDRDTDLEFAKNIGIAGFKIDPVRGWNELIPVILETIGL